MKNLTLITGGVRSGKSLLAESLARDSGLPVFYLATMPHLVEDTEQTERIQRHQSRRPRSWQTIECPYTLIETIRLLPDKNAFCLIDCLSLFVNNILLGKNAEQQESPYANESLLFSQIAAVIGEMQARPSVAFTVVTNEVGWGVVPESALGRAFRDFLGLANQEMARSADTVWLTCAGLPMKLKPGPSA